MGRPDGPGSAATSGLATSETLALRTRYGRTRRRDDTHRDSVRLRAPLNAPDTAPNAWVTIVTPTRAAREYHRENVENERKTAASIDFSDTPTQRDTRHAGDDVRVGVGTCAAVGVDPE